VNGTAPTPEGGQFVSGTYDLTAMIIYTADAGNDEPDPRRETVVITASGGDVTVQAAEISGTSLRRNSGMASASGTQVSFTPTCPTPASTDISGYTATATTFTIFEPRNGDIRLNVYTRRP
jgi:hypothetical protein